MSDLFNGLKAVSGEVKTKTLNESCDISISFRGEFEMSRGGFVQTFSYWTNSVDENIYGYVAVDDDWEYNENCNAKLNDLPIDNVYKLKETLKTSGLDTLAKSIEFSEEEKKRAMFLTIQESKDFKKHFGKKALSWDALTKDEQEMVKLNYVIDNYDNMDDYRKRGFGITANDENGNNIEKYVPTLVELIELRDLRVVAKF
jgi:hypothetical protein